MPETHTDILISRVVDGCATPQQWQALEALATRDPSLWRDIAIAQKCDRDLTAAVRSAASIADAVDIHPDEAVGSQSGGALLFSQTAFARRTRRVAAWGGWAAAAAVALAFLGNQPSQSPATGGRQPIRANLGEPLASAADALQTYLQKGREDGLVIGELPDKVLVETAKSATGHGYDVVYIRQIKEKAWVEDLYRISQDEMGNPTPIKVRFVRGGPPL